MSAGTHTSKGGQLVGGVTARLVALLEFSGITYRGAN